MFSSTDNDEQHRKAGGGGGAELGRKRQRDGSMRPFANLLQLAASGSTKSGEEEYEKAQAFMQQAKATLEPKNYRKLIKILCRYVMKNASKNKDTLLEAFDYLQGNEDLISGLNRCLWPASPQFVSRREENRLKTLGPLLEAVEKDTKNRKWREANKKVQDIHALMKSTGKEISNGASTDENISKYQALTKSWTEALACRNKLKDWSDESFQPTFCQKHIAAFKELLEKCRFGDLSTPRLSRDAAKRHKSAGGSGAIS